MKSLSEVKKIDRAPNNTRLLKHFEDNYSVVRLNNPKGTRMAEWKRLVLIYHPFDEMQWYVSAAFASSLQLAGILSGNQGCIQRKGKLYVPLPELEEVTGERIENVRTIIKDSVQQLANSL